MNRILLLLDNKTNRALLSDWLKQHYEVVIPDNGAPLVVPFDLCLIDGPTLDRLWQEVRLRKTEDAPTFLPVVLITSQREAELLTRHLWKTVDELIRVPIEKLELQARVEILLRTRQLSQELKLRNEDLESFFHAMTHDVRAPLRAIKGFAQLLQEEEAEQLGVQGRHDLERIQSVAAQMQEIIDGVIDFARVERADRQMQPVTLDQLVQRCVQHLEQLIVQSQGQVAVSGELPTVQGNVVLLMLALTNLLSNALKFVPPGVRPIVTIRAATTRQVCRLEIKDNGIGIAPEDQPRLFRPFVQLHGAEVYDGVGLGLATVRKAVELMGGRIGIISSIGQGSVFWLELRAAE
jgi:signal transduction histidine kinase